jgi:hypothetical protein
MYAPLATTSAHNSHLCVAKCLSIMISASAFNNHYFFPPALNFCVTTFMTNMEVSSQRAAQFDMHLPSRPLTDADGSVMHFSQHTSVTLCCVAGDCLIVVCVCVCLCFVARVMCGL